ncbi:MULTISPECIES: glycosyltransferase family 39 protein [Micromonospora]|uniref:glycosyltransferase family 39 protein n=1 Tax=Micromonospora TaxID=1873 RepID=UPI0018F76CD1|nr:MULTISPECIES: glycosyltransferase family 39 protein [Micromonospora]
MNDADTMVLPRLGPVGGGPEDPWDEDLPAEPRGERCRPVAGTPWIAAWLVPALVMGVLGAVRAGVPGLGTEELATWRAATASWRENWSALGSAGGTGTPYHLLMRAWAEAFGSSDLALRVPSVLAMIAAAALVGAAAARAFTPGTGLLAGLIFALLPASTRYAQEAQPYALAVLGAALATWLLLPTLDRPTRWRLAAYAGAVAVLGLCHVAALPLLAGHGWAAYAFRRPSAARWLAAASVGALPAATLLWLVLRDGGRIAPAGRPDLTALAATPAALFGVAALAGVLFVLALFSLPLRYPAAVFTAGAAVPPVVLLLVAQATPLWSPQALLVTLPAWATLAAVALSRVRTRWSVGVLAVIALIGAPAQAAVRAPDGHGPATRQLARIVEDRWEPGDRLVYDAGSGPDVRSVLARYLRADRRPADVTAATVPPTATGCVDVPHCRRLWVVRPGERADPLPPTDGPTGRMLRVGYRVAQVWRPTGFTLALLVDDRTAR